MMMSGASSRMPASAKMSNLFNQIDSGASGSISQTQFDQAFQTLSPPKDFKALGANAIWSQLDPANSGSVSKQDFVNTMTGLMRQMRGGHGSAGAPSASITSPVQTVASSAALLPISPAGSSINTKA